MEKQTLKQGNHPEQQPGEVFLENASPELFDDYIWRTKRFGKIAYNVLGMTVEGQFPVFVQRKELEEFGFVIVPG